MGKGTTSKLWKDTRVPTALLLPYINRYVAERNIGLDSLCSHIGINGAMKKRLRRGGEIPFDLADKIVVFVSHPLIWHEDPELAEVYQGLDFIMLDKLVPIGRRFHYGDNKARCAAPGCTEFFERPPGEDKRGRSKVKRGHNRQKYCTSRCAERAYKMRAGTQRRPNDSREFVCRHGHERTPETTEYLKNGTRRCRICNRERTQEFRARQKAKKEAA